MKLLLISNSTNAGEPYLEYPRHEIHEFLDGCSNIVFIPFAAVGFSYDAYVHKVNESLRKVNILVKGIHAFQNMNQALQEADAIMTGGGNTFHLVAKLHEYKLMSTIKQLAEKGIPYVGWSAGANIACPTLMTTNDMPVIEPISFATLGLVPFQINPHYMDSHPDGHAGETREQRINEFVILHPTTHVVGLREGTMLLVSNHKLKLKGNRKCRIFKSDLAPLELGSDDDFNFLLK